MTNRDTRRVHLFVHPKDASHDHHHSDHGDRTRHSRHPFPRILRLCEELWVFKAFFLFSNPSRGKDTSPSLRAKLLQSMLTSGYTGVPMPAPPTLSWAARHVAMSTSVWLAFAFFGTTASSHTLYLTEDHSLQSLEPRKNERREGKRTRDAQKSYGRKEGEARRWNTSRNAWTLLHKWRTRS